MKKLFVLLALLLIGCGGGGGGSSSSAPTPIALKTNTFRTLQAGDTWNYSGAGTINNGSGDVNLTGTIQTQILNTMKLDPVNSTNTLDQLTTISLTPQGTTTPVVSSSHYYFLQDGTGSFFNYGKSITSGDIWVSLGSGGKFMDTQSPMATGQSYGTSVIYSDGSTNTFSVSVLGTENVSTGVGFLEAYKTTINTTLNNADGTKDVQTDTEWYVPGLGIVRAAVNETHYLAGNVFVANLKFNATLTSTSVTY